MSFDTEFQTFFYISPKKLLVSVFKKGSINDIYKDEIILEINPEISTTFINQFLDKNITIIERKIKSFVNKINLIIKDKEILPIQISTKKQNSGKRIIYNELNYMLADLSQQIKKNNNDKTVIHMNISEFIIDGKIYKSLEKELQGDNLSLNVSFYCFSKAKIKKFGDCLKRYQISIQNIYSIDYLENFFKKSDLNECQMAFKYDDLNDTNEVKLVSKIKKKDGFFEKFFNLFSK